MDTQIKDIVGWIIGIVLLNISTVIASVIVWVKAIKMMPKEVKGADLNNISKEVSIASQYDELATKAAEKTLKMQERLSKLEEDYEKLNDKVDEQDSIIKEQAQIIKEQSLRLDAQDTKIKEQEEEIELLKCELNNAQSYNSALIQQMKDKNIIPIENTATNPKDCKKTKNKKITETKDVE